MSWTDSKTDSAAAPASRPSLLQTAGGKGVVITEEARRKSMSILERDSKTDSAADSGSFSSVSAADRRREGRCDHGGGAS